MIHLHKAGTYVRLGLNFEFGNYGWFPWVKIIWCWYDVARLETYGWRLRIRTPKRPWFLFSRHTSKVLDGYLMENDAVIVTRTLLEDYAPIIKTMDRYYAAGGKYEGSRSVYSPSLK